MPGRIHGNTPFSYRLGIIPQHLWLVPWQTTEALISQ